MERCTARSKQSGKRCKRWPTRGKTVCRMHGGATPIKHGLSSKFTEGTLGARIREMRDDPDLLSLERQAAVVQALQATAIEKLGENLDAEGYEILRRLTETSAKIIAKRQGVADANTVPLAVVTLLIDRVIHAVNRYVVDVATRRSIALEVTRGLDLGEALERD